MCLPPLRQIFANAGTADLRFVHLDVPTYHLGSLQGLSLFSLSICFYH